MTEREAIIKLRRRAYRTTCYGDKVLEHEENLVAIQALEKQIPEKRDNYSCPICSHYFEDGECFTYCPECGQRLE